MSTKATTGGRQTADERREAVLDAAVIEFAALGLHGASTETIAQRVGISQPYIFRLFGTKKELFKAAVDRVCDRIMAEFRLAAAAGTPVPLAALGAAFDRLMTSRDELVLLLQAFAAAKDPEALLVGRARLGEMYAYVAEVSGASDAAVQQLFAFGMLMMVGAAMDLPAIASDCPWAAALIAHPHQ